MKIILSTDAYELFYEEKGIISFELQSTTELDSIVDGIRKRKGYIPFFDETANNINDNGWYEFYLEVDITTLNFISIRAIVKGNSDNDICPDDNDIYRLEGFTSFDQNDVMQQLIEELKNHNTSLTEIRKEIEDTKNKIIEMEKLC